LSTTLLLTTALTLSCDKISRTDIPHLSLTVYTLDSSCMSYLLSVRDWYSSFSSVTFLLLEPLFPSIDRSLERKLDSSCSRFCRSFSWEIFILSHFFFSACYTDWMCIFFRDINLCTLSINLFFFSAK
jgi:hypothetical protein